MAGMDQSGHLGTRPFRDIGELIPIAVFNVREAKLDSDSVLGLVSVTRKLVPAFAYPADQEKHFRGVCLCP